MGGRDRRSCQTLYHRDQPGGDKALANKALSYSITLVSAGTRWTSYS